MIFKDLKMETSYQVYIALEDLEFKGAFNKEVQSVIYMTPKDFSKFFDF